MRLAIIGAGNVGGTLGTAWGQKAGHEIFFGVRNPASDQTQALVRRLDGKGQAGTPEQAAAFAEFIVLTTPWNAAEAAIRSMGDLSRKIILDATNPLAMGPDGLTLAIGHTISAGEKVQGWAKGASVFKTLNTTGFGNMADPLFHGARSVMFVAGDDAANKPQVIALVAALGFEVVDAPSRVAPRDRGTLSVPFAGHCTKPGSLAMFVAIRRASSRESGLAAARGSSK